MIFVKNINERCPLSEECGKKQCKYVRQELECSYYLANSRPGYEIADQEAQRPQVSDEGFIFTGEWHPPEREPDEEQRKADYFLGVVSGRVENRGYKNAICIVCWAEELGWWVEDEPDARPGELTVKWWAELPKAP